jgi:MSHA biogenesis protein MshG
MIASFAYRARDAAGGLKSGVLAGASAAAVARELGSMGLVPLEIKGAAATRADDAASGSRSETAAPAGLFAGLAALRARCFRPGAKRVQQALGLVMRELAALLRAGVPLMRALQLTADSSELEEVRGCLLRIQRDLDNGHNLVAAAEREHRQSGLIMPYDVAMLSVGEQTGRLAETFSDLHHHREFVRTTQEQVGSALRYPAFVIATCLIALVVVNLFVIPSFAKVFAQARTELPMLTKILLGMSNVMLQSWWAMLAGLVGGAWGWRRWISSERGRLWWDRVQLKLPIVGPILEGIVLSRLTASLASSIRAGLTITDALAVTARTLDNHHFEGRVQQMCAELARGTSITAAARNMAVLPPTLLQLVSIGEESGSLEELMREIAAHYQANVEQSVKRLSATLEPLLIWFLGICVLVLALGIFMPMWDLGRATMR